MGHSPGAVYPSSCFIPDKVLRVFVVVFFLQKLNNSTKSQQHYFKDDFLKYDFPLLEHLLHCFSYRALSLHRHFLEVRLHFLIASCRFFSLENMFQNWVLIENSSFRQYLVFIGEFFLNALCVVVGPIFSLL